MVQVLREDLLRPSQKGSQTTIKHFRRHPVTNGNVVFLTLNLLNVPDGTKIEGTMQRMSYIEEHRERICDWLSYDESLEVSSVY